MATTLPARRQQIAGANRHLAAANPRREGGVYPPPVQSSVIRRSAAAAAAEGSGVLTMGHELGAAIGVALVSAIAFGSGNFATGYGDGAIAAAAIAAVIGVVALLTMPSARTATGPQLAFH
jgi:hypothetical protein